MEHNTRKSFDQRVERKGHVEHVDYFDFISPATSPLPTNPREITYLGSVAFQIMLAGFGPMSDWYYATLFFLLEEPSCHKFLVEEIRLAFRSYEDITPGALTSLKYLTACLEESLRMFPTNGTGLPRLSPGAIVDGRYVPKGIRNSLYPYSRHQVSENFLTCLFFTTLVNRAENVEDTAEITMQG